MPQNFFARLGIQLPPDPRLKVPEVPQNVKPVTDFLGGFTGLGRGMLDENASKSSFLGDALGTMNPERMMMLPAAGVTRFIIRNNLGKRVPDVAARQAETTRALNQLRETLASSGARTDEIETAMDVANRYPRTLAHTGQIIPNPELRKTTAGATTFGGIKRPDMHFNPDRHVSSRAEVDDILTTYPSTKAGALLGVTRKPLATTFAHELQHVGQEIANPWRFGADYEQATNKFGYTKNPYEVAARRGSLNRIYGNLFKRR